MRSLLFFYLMILLIQRNPLYAQSSDSVKVNVYHESQTPLNSNADSGAVKFNSSTLQMNYLRRPTLPPMHIRGSKNFDIKMNARSPFNDPQQETNWDALLMPTNRFDYHLTNEYLTPMVDIVPLIVPEKSILKPLSIVDYSIPTRQELDVLQILWLKENVCDTTLYSCLDPASNMTMEDLNVLLEKMTGKGYLQREIVSPRHEFNAFGVLIEMSPQNRRNRIYSYKTNLDRDLMRKFVDANSYLFREDSTIINQKHLRSARYDSTLLRDLNEQILKLHE